MALSAKPSSPGRRLALALVAGTVVLGACSIGGDGSADGSRAAGDVAGTVAPGEGAPEPSGSETADETVGAGGVDLVAATEGRQLVSTAVVDLTAADADAVAGEIGDVVEEAGGFVSGQETTRAGGTRTTLVLRVPPGEFTAVLDALAGLADLTAQRIETDDVTEQVVDLESRITTAEASVVRLRELLDASGSVADIARVEAELLTRETTLETLRGQLRTVRQQVALATITVEVSAEDAAPVVDDDDRLPSFLGGLRTGWDALRLTLAGAAALVGVLLPWLLPAALVGVAVWRLRRARRASSTAAPGVA